MPDQHPEEPGVKPPQAPTETATFPRPEPPSPIMGIAANSAKPDCSGDKKTEALKR